MESIFLKDLAIVIAVAAATTLVCRLLRQPAVIGYLLAGLIIGPHTPPFTLISDLHSVHTMAELGLVVLMFVLGLEFSLPQLRKVGARATLATLLEIFGMLAIGYAVGRALGWGVHDSIYLGAILSISSTTIIIKVLSDLNLSKEDFAPVVFGILILEDIAAVVILTVLSGLGVRQGTEGLTILRALGGVVLFVTLFLIGGLLIVPRFLRWVARFRSSEMLGLSAFGLCLVSAMLATHFGFSTALGAFLMGAVIGVSQDVEQIEAWIHPIRDLFSALFFVAAGLLIDPKLLWSIKGPVLVVTMVTVLGKMVAGAVGTFLAGYPLKTASRVGMTLAQIGEFSFVFASIGLKTKLGSPFLYPLAVAVSGITTLITPYLIRYSDPLVDRFLGVLPARWIRALEQRQERLTEAKPRSGTAEVVSRYVWRLGIYLVLLVTGFLITKGVQEAVHATGPNAWRVNAAIWGVSWILHLPIIHAVAGYINHFLLLTLTEVAMRSRASALFQRIPIQATYDAMEAFIWMVVSFIWSFQLVGGRIAWLLGCLGAMGLAAWASQGKIHRVYSKLESLLDEVMGLASSEPLRRAALAVEDPDSLISESIQRVLVGKGSPAIHHSLRDMRIREKSGASVIGIYRNGSLHANPSPETVIAAKDILVLLGDEAECRRARALLGPSAQRLSGANE